jgi:hypothetical protein
MLMADVFSISLSIFGFFLALQGLWLSGRALAPAGFERAISQCREHPLKSFFTGLGLTLLTAVAAIVTSKAAGPGQALAIALIGAWVLLSSLGVSGLATLVGERLPSPVDARRPWRRTVRGGVVLELAFLFPIVGWFIVLPLALILGAGAAVRVVLGGAPQPATGAAR